MDHQNDDLLDDEEDIPSDFLDEDLKDQLDWEEELEAKYGDDEEELIRQRRPKVSGTGFSHQKKMIEQKDYYQGGGNQQIKLTDKTKK